MIDKASHALGLIRSTVRNSPWVAIAVALHVIGGAVLAFFQLTAQVARERDDVGSIDVSATPRKQPTALPPPAQPLVRNLVPPNPDADLVDDDQLFLPDDTSADSVDDDMSVGDPNAPDDVITGGSTPIGVSVVPNGIRGSGVSGFGGGRPGGNGLGKGDGGRGSRDSVKTEKSVLEGLRWLARHQKPDGSWSPLAMAELCNPKSPCIPPDANATSNYDEGLTGLALLAFLGAGFTHDSKFGIVDLPTTKRYITGEIVKRGLQWLVQRQHDDGSFCDSGFVYNEALAAMAVCEAYGLTQNRYWREPANKAIGFLVRAQKRNPLDGSPWGWRYASAERIEADHAAGTLDDLAYASEMSDADLSATCWAVMALKSAQLARLDVPREALAGALAFAKSVATEDGRAGYRTLADVGQKVGGVGEQFDYHAGTLTALDMLVRTFVAHDLGDPFLERGAQQLLHDLPSVSKDRLSIDYYYWYYATLALNQFDGPDSPRKSGKYWKPWNEAMVDAVLALQDTRKSCSRGAWLVDDRWSNAGHAIYNTAINTLTLEVYYRYENAFGVSAIELVDTQASDTQAGAPASAKRGK